MASPSISGVFGQPFKEQVDYWRNKKDNLVPTERWTDMQKEAHDRAFTVAGATKAELLADLAGAVDKAITKGETLEQFRDRFSDIVQRHGWQYRGGFNWRTKIIYQTNLATSYAAGRLVQLQEFPWWVYKHSGKRNFRPQHKAWDGLTLPSDHDFWRTHYPPNGWLCGCRVFGVRKPEDARRFGGRPGVEPPDDGIDPKTGAPKGIDKGWDYMPGGSVLPGRQPPPPPESPKPDPKPDKPPKPESDPKSDPKPDKPPKPDPKPDTGDSDKPPAPESESDSGRKPPKSDAGQTDSTPPRRPAGDAVGTADTRLPAAPVGTEKASIPASHGGYTYRTGWFAPLAEKVSVFPARLGTQLAHTSEYKKGIRNQYTDWLARVRRGEHLPAVLVGALTSMDIDALREFDVEPVTAELLVREGLIKGPKAARHEKKGDALYDEIWDQLPELLESPRLVVLDLKTNHLIYYLQLNAQQAPQIAIEINYAVGRKKEKVNMIVSAYTSKLSDVRGRIKGGGLIVLRGKIE